jgi:hypothetical protein
MVVVMRRACQLGAEAAAEDGLLSSRFATDRYVAGDDDRWTHAVPKALLMRCWCLKPVSCREVEGRGRIGAEVGGECPATGRQ